MSKTIDDLRDHLFAALDGLRSKEQPMEIDRVKAICDVAQTIINTAKVEVDYRRVAGDNGKSAFLEGPGQPEKQAALPPGIKGITTHRIKG